MKPLKISKILIILAILAAILVPAFTLFDAGDYLYGNLAITENKKLLIETGILALIIGAVQYLVRSRTVRITLLAALTLIFSYLHSMIFPLLLAGIYFIAVSVFGGIVTGSAVVIIVESALSLFNLGGPKKLGAAIIALAAVYAAYRIFIKKEKLFILGTECLFDNGKTSSWQLITNAVVLLVVLVQIGRAPIAVNDFDSLWYGLRGENILAPGGNIFEDLGLVGMVYTYSKGYEILTLPFSPLRSYAYIPVFNTCLFMIGLVQTYRIVGNLRQAWMTQNQKPGELRQEYLTRNGGKIDFVCLAVIITSVIPGIVNMCVSAKPDMITWVLQLIMIERFFGFVLAQRRSQLRTRLFLQVLAAYLVSLTMKPTAIVFSTALAGMMLIWWIIDIIRASHRSGYTKKKDFEEISIEEISLEEIGQGRECFISGEATAYAEREIGEELADADSEIAEVVKTVIAAVALTLVWIRTLKLTGLPFTSVFSGILTTLGFSLKYPFVSNTVPQYFVNESAVLAAAKRAAQMLLSPEGEDMNHVIIAWGGSIMFVLGLAIIISLILLARLALSHNSSEKGSAEPGAGDSKGDAALAAALLFVPFAAVCAVTLGMLIQVDGNYYMTLYSIIIISAVWLSSLVLSGYETRNCSAAAIDDPATDGGSAAAHCKDIISPVFTAAAAVMLLFQFFIMCITNWASMPGFTPIAIDKFYYDNEAQTRMTMTAQASPEAIATGNTIYDILAAQPKARLVSVAMHPQYIQFRCVAQSYNDITRPWGNRDLEETADAFIDYLHFAKVDYIFADTEMLSQEEYSWRASILEEMKQRGLLYDFIYEGNTYLARVK